MNNFIEELKKNLNYFNWYIFNNSELEAEEYQLSDYLLSNCVFRISKDGHEISVIISLKKGNIYQPSKEYIISNNSNEGKLILDLVKQVKNHIKHYDSIESESNKKVKITNSENILNKYF